jgi:nitrogen fixation NifU-like protein
MATELVIGKTVEEALEITNKAVAEALDGLPPVKMHCSNLAEEAIKAAIEDYMCKKGLSSGDGKRNACGRRCDDIHHHYNE